MFIGSVWLYVIVLGIVCMGVVYIFFFCFVVYVGLMCVVLVIFLILVFGVLWGILFLGE